MIESIFSAPVLFMIGGIGRFAFDATSEKSKKGTLKNSSTKQTKWCLNSIYKAIRTFKSIL